MKYSEKEISRAALRGNMDVMLGVIAELRADDKAWRDDMQRRLLDGVAYAQTAESRGYARGITDAANAVWVPGASQSADTGRLLARVADNIRKLGSRGGG